MCPVINSQNYEKYYDTFPSTPNLITKFKTTCINPYLFFYIKK